MFTPITITGSVNGPGPVSTSLGRGASGALLFQLSDSSGVPCGMTDSSTGQIIMPQAVAGIFSSGVLLYNAPGGGGYIPLVLLANDDPTTLPVGTLYVVTEKLAVPPSEQLAPWHFVVHHNAVGGTLDISTQRPTPS